MEKEIIQVKHISKRFKVSKREAGLKNAIKSFFKRNYKIINSLDDINFSIKEGEIVGYIGPNGAGKKVAQYPINIYEKWFRLFFTYIVPFGIVNYFPVMYLFGKSNNLYYGITPIGTIVFFVTCIFIWEIGVKHYESTGS